MNEQVNTGLAAAVLNRAKALAPDRVPQVNPETTRVWAEVLGAYRYPAEMWRDAVDVWATQMVDDRMINPRDLLKALDTIKERWAREPARKQLLRQNRELQQQRRDEVIKRDMAKRGLPDDSQPRQIRKNSGRRRHETHPRAPIPRNSVSAPQTGAQNTTGNNQGTQKS